MKAPPGRIVSLYMDTLRTIEVGDEIETRSGRRYEVQSVRVQSRGKHVGRKHLMALVLDPDHPRDPDVTIHALWWYSRS